MANTTFTGPVRSINGYEQISKNATSGAITVISGNKMATEALASAGIEGTAEVEQMTLLVKLVLVLLILVELPQKILGQSLV